MPYLNQVDHEPGCLFCRIAADSDRDEYNYVLYRGPHCFVMLNLYPYNSGHLMVVPYQHTGLLEDVRSEAAHEAFRLTQVATHVLTEVVQPEGFNVGINQGRVAGAGVADHIHLHVVPRWNGDTNFMPVLADAKVMPELLASTAAKLRPAFEREAPER
jgi:ATP adenylyltransferase